MNKEKKQKVAARKKVRIEKVLASIMFLIFTSAGISNAQVEVGAGVFIGSSGGGDIGIGKALSPTQFTESSEVNLPPASPMGQLEMGLGITFPEFRESFEEFQLEVDLITNNPLSTPSPINRLNEINTTLTKWIDAFNACSFSPEEIISLQDDLYVAQEKIEQIEIESGISIDKIANEIITMSMEVDLLSLIPRNSDYYENEAQEYLSNISEKIKLYENAFSKYNLSTQSFEALEEEVSQAQNRNRLPVSVHAQYPGMWVISYPALLNSEESKAKKNTYIETYIRNADIEIPQYLKDVSAVLEKYKFEFQDSIAIEAYAYLKSFYTNLNTLNERGVLSEATETMKLFQSLISSSESQFELSLEWAQESDENLITLLQPIVQLQNLTEKTKIYIEDALLIKNKYLKNLTSMSVHHMLPDDIEWIEKDAQVLKAEIELLSENSILIEQIIDFITTNVSAIFLELEDDSYLQATQNEISATIDHLNRFISYSLPEDVNEIDNQIRLYEQMESLLEDLGRDMELHQTIDADLANTQPEEPNLSSYLTAAANPSLGMQRSVKEVTQAARQQSNADGYELPSLSPNVITPPIVKEVTQAARQQSNADGYELPSLSPNVITPSIIEGLSDGLRSGVFNNNDSTKDIEPWSKTTALLAGDNESTYSNLSASERGVFTADMTSVLEAGDATIIATTIEYYLSPEKIEEALRGESNYYGLTMDLLATLPTDSPGYQNFMFNIISLNEENLQEAASKVLPGQINGVLQILGNHNNYKTEIDLGEVSQRVIGTSEDLVKWAIEIEKKYSNAKVVADGIVVAPIQITKNTGREVITLKINGTIVEYALDDFTKLEEEQIDAMSQALGISKETMGKFIDSIIEQSKGTYNVMWVTLDNGKTVPYIKLSDTIVYINSTNPVEIAKEIIKKVLIKRPDASSAVINRLFLFMVVAGLICIGFGVTLAIYITKAQLKKSEYFSPRLRTEKSFQHNYAASWKVK